MSTMTCTGRYQWTSADMYDIAPPLGGTSFSTPSAPAGYVPTAAEDDLCSHTTLRVESPGETPPSGDSVWTLASEDVNLIIETIYSEAVLQAQVAPILGRRRATEARALAAADDQLEGVAAVAIDGVAEEFCLGENYNDVYLSAGRHAGWLHFASESGKHLYYYSVFGAWYLHSDYTSEGHGIAAIDSAGPIPLGENEWRCYAHGKWSTRPVDASLLNTQDDVTAYLERKERSQGEAQAAEEEATAQRRKQMIWAIRQKVEQFLVGETPSFLATRQPIASAADTLVQDNDAETTAPVSAHSSSDAASGPPFPRMGVSIDGLRLIQSMFDDVITEDTSTSDVCHLIIRPLTCDPRFSDIATANHQLQGWYSHRYIVRQHEAQTLPIEVDSAPDGSKSWCDLLCMDHTQADWVAPATVFVSHAWSLNFRDVISALEQLVSRRSEDAEQIYFWFDICCVNQHISQSLPRDWWSTTFKSAIATIGNTVMMFSPWDQPVVLTRSWCLWELFCTAATEGTQFALCLPQSQLTSLELALKSNPTAVLNAISRIDVQRAQAGSETDQVAILSAVQSTPNGVEGINQLAMTEVRKWLLQTSRRLMAESDLLADEVRKTEFHIEKAVCEGHRLGVCLGHYLGAWSDALILLKKVAEGYERLMGTNSQPALGAQNQVAVAMQACGDLLGAKAVYEDVLQRQLKTIGAFNNGTLATKKNLAAVLYELGDRRCATLFQSVFECRMELLGVDHEQTLVAKADLARVKCYVLGDIEGARQDYDQVLTQLAAIGATRKPLMQHVQGQFAQILYDLGERGAAMARLRDAVQVLRTVVGPSHSYTQQWLGTLQSWEANAEPEAAQ